MASLKEVKNRITSVKSTQQITKAMKMVSAAKLRKAQDRIIQLRPYSQKLTEILQNVSSESDEQIENQYAEQREAKKVLIVPISSDKGLCGSFNATVFRRVKALLEGEYKTQHAKGNVTFLPIGKRSADFVKRAEYPAVANYSELFKNLSFDEVREAAEYAMDAFVDGTYDKVVLIYNEFKNVATQILRTEQFLPVEEKADEEAAQDTSFSFDYIFEPDQEFIVKELIPKSLKIQFYKGLLESNASEHGARMTAMDKATENAGELIRDLNLVYNKARQEAITKEILEIVAGAEALSSN